eukprot:370425-Amphidinium_carterae.3
MNDRHLFHHTPFQKEKKEEQVMVKNEVDEDMILEEQVPPPHEERPERLRVRFVIGHQASYHSLPNHHIATVPTTTLKSTKDSPASR